MRKYFLFILIIASFTFISCDNKSNTTPSIATGIIGNVKYGIGDCIPIIDESVRKYSNFNGEIYFIVKSDLDKLGNGDLEQLKANSIHTSIVNGELAIDLPENTYLIMP